MGAAQALMTLVKLVVVKTFSGKISYLFVLDHQHSKIVFFIMLRATIQDTLMAINIADTLRDTKIRN